MWTLLAIDHGWAVKWSDPSTLSRYLLHGVVVDLIHPFVKRDDDPGAGCGEARKIKGLHNL
jgi:hypothetical protein